MSSAIKTEPGKPVDDGAVEWSVLKSEIFKDFFEEVRVTKIQPIRIKIWDLYSFVLLPEKIRDLNFFKTIARASNIDSVDGDSNVHVQL